MNETILIKHLETTPTRIDSVDFKVIPMSPYIADKIPRRFESLYVKINPIWKALTKANYTKDENETGRMIWEKMIGKELPTIYQPANAFGGNANYQKGAESTPHLFFTFIKNKFKYTYGIAFSPTFCSLEVNMSLHKFALGRYSDMSTDYNEIVELSKVIQHAKGFFDILMSMWSQRISEIMRVEEFISLKRLDLKRDLFLPRMKNIHDLIRTISKRHIVGYKNCDYSMRTMARFLPVETGTKRKYMVPLDSDPKYRPSHQGLPHIQVYNKNQEILRQIATDSAIKDEPLSVPTVRFEHQYYTQSFLEVKELNELRAHMRIHSRPPGNLGEITKVIYDRFNPFRKGIRIRENTYLREKVDPEERGKQEILSAMRDLGGMASMRSLDERIPSMNKEEIRKILKTFRKTGLIKLAKGRYYQMSDKDLNSLGCVLHG